MSIAAAAQIEWEPVARPCACSIHTTHAHSIRGHTSQPLATCRGAPPASGTRSTTQRRSHLPVHPVGGTAAHLVRDKARPAHNQNPQTRCHNNLARCDSTAWLRAPARHVAEKNVRAKGSTQNQQSGPGTATCEPTLCPPPCWVAWYTPLPRSAASATTACARAVDRRSCDPQAQQAAGRGRVFAGRSRRAGAIVPAVTQVRACAAGAASASAARQTAWNHRKDRGSRKEWAGYKIAALHRLNLFKISLSTSP